MEKLFGVPMQSIMLVLAALFAVCVAGVFFIWLSNRTMFRMGLRNLPRRGAQTALVVLGLMLATLIITAAFTTGDTLNYSVTSTAYDALQRTDLIVEFESTGESGKTYARAAAVPALEQRYAGDPDIAGFYGFLVERLPALNPRTRLAEPAVALAGIDTERLARFGGLTLTSGNKADLSALGADGTYLSEKLADKLDARQGDRITLYVQGQETPLNVLGIVNDEIASGVLNIGDANDPGGMAVSLATAQRITGHPDQIQTLGVALVGDVRSTVDRSEGAAKRLQEFLRSPEGKELLGAGGREFEVNEIKRDTVKQAELFSSIFTTFFLVLGLFSIAAGIMLIFMIFVMLAAERKTEMGMARAIGAQRVNLVQMFVSEGMAYNLLSGAVGAALGVGVAFLLVVGGTRLVFGDELSFIRGHVTLRSLIVSYCLGTVLTFITVVISSTRVSRLNIVAAVRGTDDASPRERKRRHSWKWILLGILALPLPPLGLWWLLRKGIGLPAGLILGPAAIVIGALCIAFAEPVDSQFVFTLGFSLLPLGVAGIARYFHADRRVTWTAVGLYLALFWLSPFDLEKILYGRSLRGTIEMFVLSGIMVVTAFTLLIVFNARLLTVLFERGEHGAAAYRLPAGLLAAAVLSAATAYTLGDRGDGLGQLFYLLAGLLVIIGLFAAAAARFPRLAPALKMAVAYPLASRFRTGMTVAMFSLIVFSLTMFSIINYNFTQLFSSAEAKGGWDVFAVTNRNNPVPDLRTALAAPDSTANPAQIAALGRSTPFQGGQEARQAGRNAEWKTYPVRAGDREFWARNEAKLDGRATGYDSDRAVFDAMAAGKPVAVVDRNPLRSATDGPSQFGLRIKDVTITDGVFQPFDVEFRDPATGEARSVTIIGVWSGKLLPSIATGLYVSEPVYTEVFGAPEWDLQYLRLQSGVDDEAYAKGVKATLLTSGVQAFSLQEQIDTAQRQQKGFTRIFQAFMALGLLVGIAALGVIAFRSVVERRQQIGMLRAMGYQRSTISLTFLLESSFIAMMGILSGIIGAAILARNLMTSESFTDGEATQLTFAIPWGEVIMFVVAAYVFALLMTYWPSRGAARVPVAEALRYE